jgi:hypothetical protein
MSIVTGKEFDVDFRVIETLHAMVGFSEWRRIVS